MVDQRLVDYVKQYMARGYDSTYIRNYLLQYGYKPTDVDAALQMAQPAQQAPEVKHVVHLSKSTIMGISSAIVGILLFTVVIYMFIGPEDLPPELPDLSTSPLDSVLKPGDMLEINVEIYNIGSSKGYDLLLKHFIMDNEGKQIDMKTETVGVQTRVSHVSKYNLPPDIEPGTYFLKSTVSYGSSQAEAQFTFKVYSPEERPTCTDNLQNQLETGVDCGGPCSPCPTCNDGKQNGDEEGVDCGGVCPSACEDITCVERPCQVYRVVDGECFYEDVKPCCGNKDCEPGEFPATCSSDCQSGDDATVDVGDMSDLEIIEVVRQTAATDWNTAGKMCDAVGADNYQGTCYEVVATTTENSIFCAYIISDDKRDGCYMKAVNWEDYTVCSKIINSYYKTICNSLSQASEQVN